MASNKTPNFLVINSSEAIGNMVIRYFEGHGYEVDLSTNTHMARNTLQMRTYEAIVIDENIGSRRTSIEFLRDLQVNYPRTKPIVVASSDFSREAIKNGAYHFISKPFDIEVLALTIQNIVSSDNETLPHSYIKKDDLRKTLDFQKALQISNSINSSQSLISIFRLTCQAAVELMKADSSGVVYFDYDQETARSIAGYPEQQELTIRSLKIPVRGIPAEEQLISSKDVVLIKDVKKSGKFLGEVQNILINLGIRSVALIPIVYENQVIASFSLDYKSKHHFSDEEIAAGKELARQVEIAVGNLSSSENHLSDSENLHFRLLRSYEKGNLQKLIDTIVEEAVDLLNAQHGGLYLYDERRGQLTLRSNVRGPKNLQNIKLANGEGMAGRLVQSNEPYLIVADYDKWSGKSDKFTSGTFGAIVATPLVSHEGTIGVLYVGDRVGRNFNEMDASALNILADNASNMIIRTQASKARRMFEAITRIARLGEQATILEAIKQAAKYLVQCDIVEVYSYSLLKKEFYEVTSTQNIKENILDMRTDDLLDWAISQDEPYEVEDVQSDFQFSSSTYAKQMRVISLMVFPLKVKNDLVGVMFINYHDRHFFTEDERRNLGFLADQAAMAIHNSQIYDKARRQADAHKILYEAAKEITKSSESELLGKIAEWALRLADGTHVDPSGSNGFSHIALFREDFLDFVASYPPNMLKELESKGLKKIHLEPKEDGNKLSIARRAFLEGKIILAQNVLNNRDYITIRSDIISQLSIPLQVEGKNIGVLSIEYNRASAFDAEIINYITTLGTYAAVALRNAEYVKRLRSFYEISNSIATTNSPQSRLNDIISQAQKILDASWISIIRLDDENKVIRDFAWPAKPSRHKHEISLNGASATVMSTEKPIFWGDTAKFADGIHSKVIEEEYVQAAACVPLKLLGKKLGVLWVHYDRPRDYSQADQEDIEFYANLIAIALDNAIQIDELTSIHNLAQDIFRMVLTSNREGVLDTAIKGVKQLMDCGSVVLYSLDESTGRLELPPKMDGVNDFNITSIRDVPTASSIVTFILNRNEPYVVRDTDEDANFRNRRFKRIEKIKSCVALPLIAANQKRVGVLFINYYTSHNFQQNELRNLELLTRYIATGLQSLMLLEKEHRLRTQAESLGINGIAIETSFDLQNVMGEILDSLYEYVKYDKATIHLIRGDSRTILSKRGYTDEDMLPDLSRPISKDSLVSEIVQKREILIVGDVRSHPKWNSKDFETTRNITSWIGLPLVLSPRQGETEVVGFMSLDKTIGSFEDNITLQGIIEEYGRRAALAIRRATDAISATLLEELRTQRKAQIKALSEIADLIVVSKDLDIVLNGILETTRFLLAKADFVEIRLKDELDPSYLISNSKGIEVKPEYQRTSIYTGVTGNVFLTGKAIIVPDTDNEPNYINFVDGMKSELCVPLRLGGTIIGVLNIEHSHSNVFNFDHLELAETLAKLASAAIENLRLRLHLLHAQEEIVEHERESIITNVAIDLVHKINNLAGPIIPWIHLIREELYSETIDKEKIDQYFNYIIKDASSILKEGQGLQGLNEAFARSELVDISYILRAIIGEIQIMAPEVTINLINEDFPPIVLGVERQLSTAFYNVVQNAVKAVSYTGNVLIKIRKHHSEVKNYVEVDIADDGIGVMQGDYETIFEFGTSHWKDHYGSGFGLWRARVIFEHFGGSIKVSDYPLLKGATFIILLPITTDND